MIEIVYKEEKKEAKGNEGFFRLPNNIRQIGECKGKQKIYMEDFAYTFLRRFAEKNPQEQRVAILLGKCNWTDGITYRFIRSAIAVENMEVSQENICFNEQVWKQVQSDMEQYFPEQEILGWFLSSPELPQEVSEVILRAHLNHFAGNDKVLFMMEPLEREEAFYTYENAMLKRENGYYIYYEKNEPMQSYMIDHKQSNSLEDGQVPDRAVRDFRKILGNSPESGHGKGISRSMVYGLGSLAVLAAVVYNVGFSGNYEELKTAVSDFTGIGKTDSVEVSELSQKEVSGRAVTPEVTQEPKEPQKEPQEKEDTPKPEISAEPPKEEFSGMDEDADETTAGVYREYTIKKGDTISRISEHFYGTLGKIEEICKLNQLDPEEIIYVGQKILLPR